MGFAGELIFGAGFLGKAAHRAARLIGIFKPIKEHRILDRIMANPRAAPVLGEHIGRVGHALHPACDDDIGCARNDRFRCHHRRFHARSADLVDRRCANRKGQTCPKRRLTGRGLAKRTRQNAAHNHLIDGFGLHASTFYSGLDCGCTKLCSGNPGKRALHPPHRRAGIGCDDDRISGHDLGLRQKG